MNTETRFYLAQDPDAAAQQAVAAQKAIAEANKRAQALARSRASLARATQGQVGSVAAAARRVSRGLRG